MTQYGPEFIFVCDYCGRTWDATRHDRGRRGRNTGFIKAAKNMHESYCELRSATERRKEAKRAEARWKKAPPQGSIIRNDWNHRGMTGSCDRETEMNKPMSAEGARAMAADLQNGKADEREIAATLRAYADMRDRQTVDREAVAGVIARVFEIGRSAVGPSVNWASRLDEATDAILSKLQNVQITDGMVMVPREPTEAMLFAGNLHSSMSNAYRAMLSAAPTEGEASR